MEAINWEEINPRGSKRACPGWANRRQILEAVDRDIDLSHLHFVFDDLRKSGHIPFDWAFTPEDLDHLAKPAEEPRWNWGDFDPSLILEEFIGKDRIYHVDREGAVHPDNDDADPKNGRYIYEENAWWKVNPNFTGSPVEEDFVKNSGYTTDDGQHIIPKYAIIKAGDVTVRSRNSKGTVYSQSYSLTEQQANMTVELVRAYKDGTLPDPEAQEPPAQETSAMTNVAEQPEQTADREEDPIRTITRARLQIQDASERLQMELNDAQGADLKVDGHIGPKTIEALKKVKFEISATVTELTMQESDIEAMISFFEKKSSPTAEANPL